MDLNELINQYHQIADKVKSVYWFHFHFYNIINILVCSLYLQIFLQVFNINSHQFLWKYKKYSWVLMVLINLVFIVIYVKLQSWPKYMRQTLVLVWSSTLREKFNFNFWTIFRLYWQNVYFGRKTGH